MLDQDTNLTEKSLPNERWMVKVAEWIPELNSRYKASRAIERPRTRCEDNINEFLKLEKNETENSTESETNHGSKQQKTVEGGFYLEKTSQ